MVFDSKQGFVLLIIQAVQPVSMWKSQNLGTARKTAGPLEHVKVLKSIPTASHLTKKSVV